MAPWHLLVATSVAAVVATTSAFAQAPARVRGKITAMDDGSITVKEQDGRTFSLHTDATTQYAQVVPASLDAVRINDYIGTAIKGPISNAIAVEIVLVPESMRAGRIGNYVWDALPDTSGIDVAATPGTTVTNGVVANVGSTAAGLAATTMTNGTVVGNDSGAAARMLTVALVSNETAHITVSPTAPVTRFIAADRSVVTLGANTVVWTARGTDATLVAIGKGITPPM